MTKEPYNLNDNHVLVDQEVFEDPRYGGIHHKYSIHCDTNYILGNPPIHYKFVTKCINVMMKCTNCGENLRINNGKKITVPVQYFEVIK